LGKWGKEVGAETKRIKWQGSVKRKGRNFKGGKGGSAKTGEREWVVHWEGSLTVRGGSQPNAGEKR